MNDLFVCIVNGAGPAGLSASLFLARYRRKVLTLHNNSPRNLYSQGYPRVPRSSWSSAG
jgi:thioredoxin reductase